MRKLIAVAGFVLLFGAGARGQTPQDAIQVSANPGDPSWGTFVFGHTQNGQPGETELIVQCDFHRAELITNFDVYGLQRVSQFFAVSCAESVTYQNFQRVATFTVNAVPLYESLIMSGRDQNGNSVTENLNLIVDHATWTVKGGGRWETTSGSAGIAY